jgi:hypothetical protein
MASDDEFLQATLPALDLVHNLARRFAQDRADAEDLVQDTYLRAWQAWTNGNRPRHPDREHLGPVRPRRRRAADRGAAGAGHRDGLVLVRLGRLPSRHPHLDRLTTMLDADRRWRP